MNNMNQSTTLFKQLILLSIWSMAVLVGFPTLVMADTPPEVAESLLLEAAAQAIAESEVAFTVGSVRVVDDWGLISLRPTDKALTEIGLARWQDEAWRVALPNSEPFMGWLAELPETVMAAEAKALLKTAMSAAAPDITLLLPFPANQTWRYLAGPNGPPYRRAVDFGPLSQQDPPNPYTSLTGRERDVTAAAAGVVVDRDKNLLLLRHAYGWETYYYGLAESSIRHRLGEEVKAGDVIGLASNEVDPRREARVSFWVRRHGVDQSADGLVLSGWRIGRDNSYASGEGKGTMVSSNKLRKFDCHTVTANYLDRRDCHVTHFTTPILSFTPQVTRFPQGGNGHTRIELFDVVDLKSIEFSINIDPDDSLNPPIRVARIPSLGTILHNRATPENPVTLTNSPTFFRRPVLTVAATLDPPFSGSGTVLDIVWENDTTFVGEVELLFATVILRDSAGQQLPVTLRDGAIQTLSAFLVEGRIQAQGRMKPADVRMTMNGQAVSLNDDGQFSMSTAGEYEIDINAPQHLSVKLKGEATERLDLGNIILLAGDMTSDNKIDVFDLAYISNHFDSTDPLADLNGDGQVNILDVAIAAANYGQQGPIVR